MDLAEAIDIIKNRPFDPYHNDLKALRTVVLHLLEREEKKPKKVKNEA